MNAPSNPDGSNVEKIRELFLSGTPEGVRLGRLLLEALGPSERDYRAIFSDDVMQSLVGKEGVDDVRVELWNQVTTVLLGDSATLSSFKGLARKQVAHTAEKGQGRIEFQNVTSLNDHVAELLATAECTYSPNLELPSISALPPGVAGILANNCSRLFLDGLVSLPSDVAVALAGQVADADGMSILSLGSLAGMPVEAEKALANHEGLVYLNSVQSIVTHDLAFKLLKQIQGYAWPETFYDSSAGVGGDDLFLDSLQSLSPSFLEALRSLDEVEFFGDEFLGFGTLSLNGITTLTSQEAEHLILHTGDVVLNGVATLTDAVAAVLAGYRMPRTAEPPPESSTRAETETNGTLSLMGLTTISDSAKALLRANPNIQLPESL